MGELKQPISLQDLLYRMNKMITIMNSCSEAIAVCSKSVSICSEYVDLYKKVCTSYINQVKKSGQICITVQEEVKSYIPFISLVDDERG